MQAVRVPATSANLGPGFDAFGVAVDRHLVVRSVPRGDQRQRVRTTGVAADELPEGDDNLIWRALTACCDGFGLDVPDVALVATSDVPLERGLGSSAAAIVAGVALARALTGAAIGDLDLVRLAAGLEGHPDNVAPALLGGLVACTVDDAGRLVVRRAQPAARLRPVVLVPRERQATTAARAVLPGWLSRAQAGVQAARAGHVLGALLGVWPVDAAAAGDHLHEPARLELMPRAGDLIAALRDAGVHAWLSGAGPGVVAAVADADPGALATCTRIGEQHGMRVEACWFDLAGAVAWRVSARE